MTLEYDLDKRLKELVSVLDEYSEWFTHIVRRICYPAHNENDGKFTNPESFLNWVANAGTSNFEPEIIKRLQDLHRDLFLQADKLVAEVENSKEPPEFHEFDKFMTFFEEFISQVRRLEKDCLLDDTGIDSLTGLRSMAMMQKDIDQEMERLARQGRVFSFALVRINNLEDIRQALGREGANHYLKLVADLILKSVRTFDDAYRLENDEFALSLKQTYMDGGVRALNRLRDEMESLGTTYQMNGKEVPLTLSSCIAEPLPGDDIDDMLKNLRADLDECDKTESNVMEYVEISPLQRYVKNVND